MATVQLNGVLMRIKGGLGDIVFKKRGNTLYMCRRPDFSKRVLSDAQKNSIARFQAAVRHAKQVLADPEARKPFEATAEKTGRTVFHTVMAEQLSTQK